MTNRTLVDLCVVYASTGRTILSIPNPSVQYDSANKFSLVFTTWSHLNCVSYNILEYFKIIEYVFYSYAIVLR